MLLAGIPARTTDRTRRCPSTRGSRGIGADEPAGRPRISGAGSALGVLRGLASLPRTGLLALDDAVVAREEPGLLQGGPVVLDVDLVQRARDTEPDGTGLTGGAATVDADEHVEAALEVEGRQRVVDL